MDAKRAHEPNARGDLGALSLTWMRRHALGADIVAGDVALTLAIAAAGNVLGGVLS